MRRGGAGWLALIFCLGAGVAVAEPPPAAPDEGRERFERGVALAEAGNCEAALAEFEASLRVSRRPSVLYSIARCEQQLGRYDQAVKAYEEYLAIADPADPDRRAAEATLSALRRLLGTIQIESNVTAEVWLGNRMVGTAPGDVRVPGGRHAIEIRRDGYLPVRREVEIAAMQMVRVSVVLEAAQKTVQVTRVEEKRVLLPRKVFWGGVIATSACLGAGIGFGVHAWMVDKDARDKDARLPKDGDISTIKRSRTLADIFYVSAAVLGAGTTAIYFLTDWNRETPRIAPTAGQGSVGAVVEGVF